MSYKLLFFILLFGSMSCQFGPGEVVYEKNFLDCGTEYIALERISNPKKFEGDNYLLKGSFYSGCARADYPNKKQYTVYTFQNGYLFREKGYYYNGMMARSFEFEQGLRQGVQRMFLEDGTLHLEESYKDGKPEGFHRRWHDSGQLARVAFYKKGKMKSEKIFDAAGKLVSEKK